MNSLACSTMRRLHQIISTDPRFSHVFMVLCDSHGLQLLIEAIVSKHQGISDIMEKAQAIVAAFAHSKLRFAILRRHQTDCYGRTKGLIAVSFIRWSTQYGVVSSLLRSKEALQRYGLDQRAALKGRQHMLVDRAFWNDLEDVEVMLRPLNEAQTSVRIRWCTYRICYLKMDEDER